KESQNSFARRRRWRMKVGALLQSLDRRRSRNARRDILVEIALVDDFVANEFGGYGRARYVRQHHDPSDGAPCLGGTRPEFRLDRMLQLPHPLLRLPEGAALQNLGFG